MALHPFIEAMILQFRERPAISAGSPDEAREMLAAGRSLLGGGPDMASVSDIAIPTAQGDLPARLFVPQAEPIGLIVYIHGGGWVIGNIDDFDTFARALAKESGCAVLLPDYRLAPEHPFPAPLDDTESALLFAQSNMTRLAGGELPLIVAGDSAGANLATVAARRLKDRLALALQVLIYPVTDCDFETPSYRSHGVDLPLKTADMKWFFSQYVPDSDWRSPDVSPLRSEELAGLPPTVVTTAEFDVLADEGSAYAAKLEAAGVPVIARQVAGVTHGYIRFHTLFDVAREELAAVAGNIREVCLGPCD